jgi:toxin CptA
MHSAPSVSYPVGRSLLAGVLLLLIWLLAAAGTGLWWAQVEAPGWRVAAAALVLVGSGLWAAWSWWHAARGSLAWDGECWNWSARGRAATGEPQVSLDLQRCLLLRWAGTNGRDWLWLERRERADRWDDLRRAVYSRARPQALPTAIEPAAKP